MTAVQAPAVHRKACNNMATWSLNTAPALYMIISVLLRKFVTKNNDLHRISHDRSVQHAQKVDAHFTLDALRLLRSPDQSMCIKRRTPPRKPVQKHVFSQLAMQKQLCRPRFVDEDGKLVAFVTLQDSSGERPSMRIRAAIANRPVAWAGPLCSWHGEGLCIKLQQTLLGAARCTQGAPKMR
jgi:hypothetical protein